MLKKQSSEEYDAIIIGAGIGGLVCGCYLAKVGMKVLICEQHYKPGGYCTSFRRGPFVFDAAAHSFGGYREGGIVRKVFTELGIDKKLKIKKFDPSDIIITPDYKVSFWTDLDKTVKDFQLNFPKEKINIEKFFYFLINSDPVSFTRLRSYTFRNLLDQYFTDEKLKAILSVPLFGNGGLPPSLLSAFIGTKLFMEFLLDGGYYPEGGMQKIPDALVERLKEFGGEIMLSSLVKKIKVKDKKVIGVVLEKYGYVPSKYVISNRDAKLTFLKLLEKEIVGEEFLKRLDNMVVSLSMFVLYLGINRYFNNLPEPGTNVWFLPHYNLDDLYITARDINIDNFSGYMMRVSPDRKTILAFINSGFKDKKFWDERKKILLEVLIKRIESSMVRDLSKHIVYKSAATPYELYRYTLNYKGAAYGWASTPLQLANHDFSIPSFVQGLYMTGHWSTKGMGISGVIYLGRETAKSLTKRNKILD